MPRNRFAPLATGSVYCMAVCCLKLQTGVQKLTAVARDFHFYVFNIR
jgi:hypothetical protein